MHKPILLIEHEHGFNLYNAELKLKSFAMPTISSRIVKILSQQKEWFTLLSFNDSLLDDSLMIYSLPLWFFI